MEYVMALAMVAPAPGSTPTTKPTTLERTVPHQVWASSLRLNSMRPVCVTRPVLLDAMIWRQKGHAPGDLSQLTVRLTGAVLRSDYGATGWADMVGDEVRLTILARIARAD